MRDDTNTPALAIVRATPNKTWGSGITLDPAKEKAIPMSPVGIEHRGGDDDDDAPSARRFLERMRDEYNAEWVAGRRKLLATEAEWLRDRITAAMRAIKRTKHPERRAEREAELADDSRKLDALPAKILNLTTPAPAAWLDELESHPVRTPSGEWQTRAALRNKWEGGEWSYRLSFVTPDDRLAADVDVAGVHVELAARLVRVMVEYSQECNARTTEASVVPSPLTLC